MRVLVVAAHPDDEVLGVGGTVRRHSSAGDEVVSLIAAEGVSVRYSLQDRDSVEDHSRQAADILGVKEILFGSLPEQRLDTLPVVDVIALVEEQVRRVQPDIVYTHFGGDVNRDHRVLFEAVQVATRPYACSVREVLLFDTASSTEWGAPTLQGAFLPQVFVDISDTLPDKLRAFACYERELRPPPHPRSLQSLEAKATVWGSVSGFAAAEAFQVLRSLR